MWWNKYVGTKFAEKGRSAEGVDCWGLVCLIYKNELGIDLPHYLECYNSTNDTQLLAKLIDDESKAKWVEQTTPKEFDVLVLKVDGLPFHVGIYTHDRKFIHCEKGFNTVVSKLDSMRWVGKMTGVFRWVI